MPANLPAFFVVEIYKVKFAIFTFMIGEIHYGFGPDYLKTWTIKSALREIYQNFIDYGKYESTEQYESDIVNVHLKNDWSPEGLEFLRVGNSTKANDPNSIGKHGEGFKMGSMILLREGFSVTLRTPRFTVWPEFYDDPMVGKVFLFKYKEEDNGEGVSIEFTCPVTDYTEFVDGIITTNDVLFDDNYYGRIVNKTTGNIYSGGLFVCNVSNLSKAYDIRPQHMLLDRDRQVPRSFDVSWASSKINQAYGKFTAKDLSMSDTQYIDKVPDQVVKQVKPVVIGNDVQLAYISETGETVMIKNQNAVDALKREGLISRAIRRIKSIIAKKLGLYDMLLEFEKKHVHTTEARIDFSMILAKASGDLIENETK